GRLNVGCLHAFAALIVLDLESDFVTFIEGEAGGLEGRGGYENIFFAVLGRDEAEAARLIEKFDCASEAHGRVFLSRKGRYRAQGLTSRSASRCREEKTCAYLALWSYRRSKSAPTMGVPCILIWELGLIIASLFETTDRSARVCKVLNGDETN